MKNRKKAVSPLISIVLIVAFTIAAAVIVVSSLISVTKQQTEAVAGKEGCARGALNIIATSCTDRAVTAIIQNIGTIDLSNFTVFANINGRLSTNTTPQGGTTVLKPGEILTLIANMTYSGAIAELRVSAGNCPISISVKNTTSAIGTC